VAVPGAGGGKWIVVGGYSVGRGGATGFLFVVMVMYILQTGSVKGSRLTTASWLIDRNGGYKFPQGSLRLEK